MASTMSIIGDARHAVIPSEPIDERLGTIAHNGSKADLLPALAVPRAPVEARGDNTLSYADFLSALSLQLRLSGPVFTIFGLIAFVAFGSVLAISGLVFIGVTAWLLGLWTRPRTHSGWRGDP